MALLSMIEGNKSEALTSSISGETLAFFFLVVMGIILICGLTWLIVKAVNLMNEMEKNYINLNKRVQEEGK